MFKKINITFVIFIVFAAELLAQNTKSDANDKYYTDVKTCLDILIKYGRDTYGPVKSPIFVSILDVNSKTCPQNPLPLDEKWRVIRRERRNPAGANLFTDQPLINTMILMSQLT